MEKNNKTLNVPPLRFPEFSKEWEKATLQSVATLSKGTGISKDQLSEEGLPCILYGELYTKYNSEIIDTIISKTDIDPEKLVRSQANDVIIPCSGESAVDIATARCVKQSKVLLGGDLNIIRLKGEHDGSFFAYQLNGKRKYDIAKVAQGVSVVHLYGEHLKRVMVNYPSATEQKKISSLLALIDQRIETQKKIIEDLKKLKDAICNMNFTSGSALKLGNVGKFVRGLTYSASDVIDDTMGTAVMRSNNISNGDPANFEELIWVNKTPNHEQILRGGDIIICMANGSSPLVGKASYYIDCGMESATVGAFCGIYRSYNPLTKWLFQSKHYKKHIQRCIQGGNGAIANIYPEDILAISFNIPSGYERVLNVLNYLEEKYLLEQKLLYRYLAVKSHLLAQLFI